MEVHKDFEKLEIPLIAKLFVIYYCVHKLILTLPKFERYSLGEAMQRAVLEACELVVEANSANKYDRPSKLIKVNAKIEITKLLVRIALNMELIKTPTYLEIQTHLQEAGKMTQGWIKYSKNNV